MVASVLAAAAVLGFNDWYLKPHHPGFWSGKLSDLSGLFLAPLLTVGLTLVLRRRLPVPLWLGTALVGAVFIAVKLSPSAAQWTAALWPWFTPSRIVSDPTDLWTLPALPLGHGVALRFWDSRRSSVERAASG